MTAMWGARKLRHSLRGPIFSEDTARRVKSGDLMPRRSYEEALSHYICVKTDCWLD